MLISNCTAFLLLLCDIKCVYNSVFVQYEISSVASAAGDNVNNVLERHRAAVQIQRWFRLLWVRRQQSGRHVSSDVAATAGKGKEFHTQLQVLVPGLWAVSMLLSK